MREGRNAGVRRIVPEERAAPVKWQGADWCDLKGGGLEKVLALRAK